MFVWGVLFSPALLQAHLPGFLVSARPNRRHGIGRNLPALLPDRFLYGTDKSFGHAHHVANERGPGSRIFRIQLAGCLDFRIPRRFLRGAGWRLIAFGRDRSLMRIPESHW